MNVLIVGYGEMGRHVEAVLARRNHTIIGRVDPFCGEYPAITKALAGQADMAIEYSQPDAAMENIKLYAEFRLSCVMATTGWYNRAEEARKLVEPSGIGFIYGPNFSIGANLFFKLVAKAAALINPFPQYDIMGYEIHHHRKKDSPSGTAKTTAELILKNNHRKTKLVEDKLDRPVAADELHFASLRGGDVPGTHKVLLDCPADTIEISHTARSRLGFAEGSVLAAEWLQNKQGFFKSDDFIDQILK